ncbi:MAG: chitobiase/beta-hexosaminidase C-terminal domain-containing protein [Terracidiphilus sp.]
MRTLFLSTLALTAISVPALAITVYTPANGAQVSSPFKLTASTQTCDLKPAVSMGYSIDSGKATIVSSTAFSATVPAALGNHVLHVKCWGSEVVDEKLINITVVPASVLPAAATPAFSPASGQYTSTQVVTLSAATPGATIYYTTNGSAPTTSSAKYSEGIAVGTSTVIEAVAVAQGYTSSGLARAQYVITPPLTGPTIPSDAITVAEVQLQPNWEKVHDPGTLGSSTGAMTLVTEPSLSGEAAEFDTTFTDWGGELYSKSYATDANATNFLYDAEVWIESGSLVGNLEMDNNQVIANGDTVIYAFQCAGDSNTWDYSENAGTLSAPVVKWVRSDQPCNPANWTPNAWHHVQISYSRDDVGNVTYNSVWLDGVEAPINETVPSAFALGWAKGDLMTNFQVDGVGAGGSSVLYLDKLTIYRW